MYTIRKNKAFDFMVVALLTLTLLLSSFNAGTIMSYASSNDEMEYKVGDNITAILYDDGFLHLSGDGDTYNYSNKDGERSPFYEDRARITSIEIDEGITSLGDYLFYNCENMSGELTIPSTVISIGGYAFSGEGYESSPKLSYIYNEFIETEVVMEKETEEKGIEENNEEVNKDETVIENEPTEENNVLKASSNLGEIIEEVYNEDNLENNLIGEDEESEGADNLETKDPANTLDDSSDINSDTTGETKIITEQEVGEEIFFPGQVGVFELQEDKNESFCKAVENAEYVEILSYNNITFNNGFGNSCNIEVPLTEKGLFLPNFIETNLDKPDDTLYEYRFLGWNEIELQNEELDEVEEKVKKNEIKQENTLVKDEADKTIEDEKVAVDESEAEVEEQTNPNLIAHSFYSQDITELTAAWEVLLRRLENQTISTIVSGASSDLRVIVNGSLPENAKVLANFVEVEAVQNIVDKNLGQNNGNMVLYALDITILVGNKKYQPSDYGDSVQVSVANIKLDKEKPLAVYHLDENDGESKLETVQVENVEKDEVAFTAERFSTYIIALTTYKVTFNDGEGYTITNQNDKDFEDVVAFYNYTIKEAITSSTSYKFTIDGGNTYKYFTLASASVGDNVTYDAYNNNLKYNNTSLTIGTEDNSAIDITSYLNRSYEVSLGDAMEIGFKVVADEGFAIKEVSSKIEGATQSTALTATNDIYTASTSATIGEEGSSTTFNGNCTIKVEVSGVKITGVACVGETLTANTIGITASNYKWQLADTKDGTYTDITGATDNTYSVQNSESGKYIKVVVSDGADNNTEYTSASIGPMGNKITFDLSKGSVVFDTGYSGYDINSNVISGTHNSGNVYVIEQANYGSTATTNTITVKTNNTYGDKVGNFGYSYNIMLSGVNIKPSRPTYLDRHDSGVPFYRNDLTGLKELNSPFDAGDSTVTVNLILKDGMTNTLQAVTNGSQNGLGAGLQYIKYKEESKYSEYDAENGNGSLNIFCEDAYKNESNNCEYDSCGSLKVYSANKANGGSAIGAPMWLVKEDVVYDCWLKSGDINVNGGKIEAYSTSQGAAIGGGACTEGGNTTINGGYVFAKASGNGAGIGGGGGSSNYGADGGVVTINGGSVKAYSSSSLYGAAIGGGGSGKKEAGKGIININGGKVIAKASLGVAIGGGSSGSTSNTDSNEPGSCIVTITGGEIYASASSKMGIGGGNSSSNACGGIAVVNISGGIINMIDSNIGGGNTAGTKDEAGTSEVVISGGTLFVNHIGDGRGSDGYGNGNVVITGGSVKTTLTVPPVDNEGNPLFLTRVTIYHNNQKKINNLINSLNGRRTISSVITDNALSHYGCKDVMTDETSMLYLWLPSLSVVEQAFDNNGVNYLGEVVAGDLGFLGNNSSAGFFDINIANSPRHNLYLDEACQEKFSGITTIGAGEDFTFYLQSEPSSYGEYYTIEAYRSPDSGYTVENLPSVNSGRDGLYQFTIKDISTDIRVWFTSFDGYNTRDILDLSSGDIIIEEDPDNSELLQITNAGYILSGYSGTFYLTSDGYNTDNSLIVKSGKAKVFVNKLIISSFDSAIQVQGGELTIITSDYDDQISSFGSSAISVNKGASLNLIMDDKNNSLKVTSLGGFSAIDGEGEVSIVNVAGGSLYLNTDDDVSQIKAEKYSYTTPYSFSGGSLPYSLELASGGLIGYCYKDKLYSVNSLPSVDNYPTFTSCGIAYNLREITASEEINSNGLNITLTPGGGKVIGSNIYLIRDGVELAKDTDYTLNNYIISIPAANSYGNFLVSAAAENEILYTSSDYVGDYNGENHTITVKDIGTYNDSHTHTIYYSDTTELNESNYNTASTTTAPTKNDVGTYKIYWYIHCSTGGHDVAGSNTININKVKNEWTKQLTCQSVSSGVTPVPTAMAKFGNVEYIYKNINENSYTNIAPTSNGTYLVRAKVEENSNYYGLISDPVQFILGGTDISYSNAVPGRVLSGITGANNNAVSFNSNDGFTVRYVYNKFSTYGRTVINFANPLPNGTKLTLIDFSEPTEGVPGYYYYDITNDTTSQIIVSDFIKMGTSNTKFSGWTPGNGEKSIMIDLQICVDLPDNNTSTSPLDISLSRYDTSGITLTNMTASEIETTSTVSMVVGKVALGTAIGGSKLTIPITVTKNSTDKVAVLAFSLLNDDNTAAIFPIGTKAILRNSDNKVLPKTVVRGNTGIYNLGTANYTNEDYSLEISVSQNKFNKTESYKIKVELCVVDADEGTYPCHNIKATVTTDLLSLNLIATPTYDLNASLAEGNSRVVKYSTTDPTNLSFNLDYDVTNVYDTPSIICTTQSKLEGIYTDMDTSWTTTGLPTNIALSNGSASGNDISVAVTVPANTPVGTYRINFTLGDVVFPYNIIVTDK